MGLASCAGANITSFGEIEIGHTEEATSSVIYTLRQKEPRGDLCTLRPAQTSATFWTLSSRYGDRSGYSLRINGL